MPAFPTYPREAAGAQDRIYLLALGYGRLTLRGRCLGMVNRGGSTFTMIVWPYTARLGRDSQGLFVTDSESGATIRLGDEFTFGGGDNSTGSYGFGEPLSEPVPADCSARVATLNPGSKGHATLSANPRPPPARFPSRP